MVALDDRLLLPAWDATDATDEGVSAPAPGPTPAPSRTPPGTFGLRILGVSEVARAVREAVRADDRLNDVWVEGEVGRVTVSSAGHAYFSLKDDRSALQCVWFRDERVRSAFQPQAGLRIVVHGRVDLFEPQGALQLYVESIQPAGFGDLTLRFEALKAKLAQEGLFDTARKRPLPARPTTIAVITSPTGVVWRDIGNVLARRWPLTRVVLVACQVQGDEAPASIVAAFRRLERWLEQLRARRPRRRRAAGHDPRPRRRQPRGPLVVQRRAGRPGGRRPRPAGRVRRRPRGRRHAGRFRGRRPGADAVGRGGARRPGPGRLAGVVPAGGGADRRRGLAVARSDPPRARRRASGPRPARPAGPARRRPRAGGAPPRPGRPGRGPGPGDRAGPAWTPPRTPPRGRSSPGSRRPGRRSTRRAAALAVLGPAGDARARLRDRPARRGRARSCGPRPRRPAGTRLASARRRRAAGDGGRAGDDLLAIAVIAIAVLASGSALVCSWPARSPAGPDRDDEEPDDD